MVNKSLKKATPGILTLQISIVYYIVVTVSSKPDIAGFSSMPTALQRQRALTAKVCKLSTNNVTFSG